MEKYLDSWQCDRLDPEEFAREIQGELRHKIRIEVLRHIELQLKDGLLDKLATDAIAKFNMEELYGTALKEAVKSRMFANQPNNSGPMVAAAYDNRY